MSYNSPGARLLRETLEESRARTGARPIVECPTLPYYRAAFSSVDGAGTLGEYPTLEDAISACEHDRPKGENPYGYRYRVTAQYGVYRDEPRDIKWTSSDGRINA